MYVDDYSGRVTEAWTGFQVAWTMARGYPGAFGRRVNSWYVWIPLCILFVAPFLPWRRRPSLLHLDLLVLVAFSISLAFFNHALIGISVPLAYPFLLYLLVRMLLLAFGRGRPREPLRLIVPVSWLAIATIFLVGFRVGLNVTDSNVIDVGYAGRDRRRQGDPRRASCTATGPRTTPTATPTARSTTTRTSRLGRSSAGAAPGTTFPRRARRRSRSTCSRCWACTSWGGGSAVPRSGWCSRMPGPPTRSRSTRSARTATTRWSRCWSCSSLLVIRSAPGRGIAGALSRLHEVRAVGAGAVAVPRHRPVAAQANAGASRRSRSP